MKGFARRIPRTQETISSALSVVAGGTTQMWVGPLRLLKPQSYAWSRVPGRLTRRAVLSIRAREAANAPFAGRLLPP